MTRRNWSGGGGFFAAIAALFFVKMVFAISVFMAPVLLLTLISFPKSDTQWEQWDKEVREVASRTPRIGADYVNAPLLSGTHLQYVGGGPYFSATYCPPGHKPRTGQPGWVNPVPGWPKTSSFRNRDLHGNGNWKCHWGLDIGAPTGTPILAAAEGKVTATYLSDVYGYMVIINHGNGIDSRYAHMDEVWVRPGHIVYAGDPIGAVGDTGYSFGSHLHFEIHAPAGSFASMPVDPENYIGFVLGED